MSDFDECNWLFTSAGVDEQDPFSEQKGSVFGTRGVFNKHEKVGGIRLREFWCPFGSSPFD